MSNKTKVVVAGLGEIGRPIFQLAAGKYDVVGVDISPVGAVDGVNVLHICYPFQIPDFIGESVRYIQLFRPSLTIINSTVAVGTTREIAQKTCASVVNSPVRGKHARMIEDLRFYRKFVGALDCEAGRKAAEHFESLGMQTRVLPSPEATELAKLTETTYFGVLIAWAQEVERCCDFFNLDYDDIVAFYDEIAYLPRTNYFPGVIGGHCVMPNIEIMRRFTGSALLEAVRASNELKIRREAARRDAISREVPESLTA